MRFRLGTYSIRLRSYNSNDLELKKEYSHLKFILYQKVFHILFIPFSPVERYWKVLNKSTGKEELTTPELRTALNLKSLKRKNPFWAYFGWAILLLPVVFVFYQLASDGIYEGIKSIKKSNRTKEIVTELSTDITDKLESPKLKDVYHIQMVELESDLSENQKNSRPIVKYLEYVLLGYSENNFELELSVNKEFKTKYVLPKEKITVSKEDILKIIGDFERLDIYTMKADSINAHALFKVQQIARN